MQPPLHPDKNRDRPRDRPAPATHIHSAFKPHFLSVFTFSSNPRIAHIQPTFPLQTYTFAAFSLTSRDFLHSQ